MRLDIALEINIKIYEKYGKNQYYDLKTQIFRKMIVENKKEIVNANNLYRHLPFGKSKFDKLKSGSITRMEITSPLIIAIALASSSQEAQIFLSGWGVVYFGELRREFEFYNYLIEKYCINDYRDGIERLNEANLELVKEGYEPLYKE